MLSESYKIYEDPGHKEEGIYKWLKRRNLCEINKENIKYVLYVSVLRYVITTVQYIILFPLK